MTSRISNVQPLLRPELPEQLRAIVPRAEVAEILRNLASGEGELRSQSRLTLAQLGTFGGRRDEEVRHDISTVIPGVNCSRNERQSRNDKAGRTWSLRRGVLLTVPSVLLEVSLDESELLTPIGLRHRIENPFAVFPHRVVLRVPPQGDVRELEVRL